MSELCESEGAAISIEDDHQLAPDALRLLDCALDRYRSEESVFQVCAYRPGRPLYGTPDTFFLPMPMPAGWATWDRAWARFSWDCREADAVLMSPRRRHEFDLDGAFPAAALLADALAAKFTSYFIRWYCAMFRAGGLALCPRESMVRNLGLGSGVHGHGLSERRARFHNGAWTPHSVDEWTFPAAAVVDSVALGLLREDLMTLQGPPAAGP